MAHRRHRRQDPFVSQSAQDAVVRYGPETSALNELRREAIETAQTSVRAARSAGADVRRSVGAAGPPIRAAYGQALSTASQQAGIAASDLAGMPANSPFRAAAALEQTGLAGRLGESQAAALTDLSRRRVAAAEGTRSAVGAARSTLADALMKVANRRIDLAREQGAFTASEAQQLRTEARKEAETLAIAQGRNAQSERNSMRSAGIDPDTGKPIPGGPLTGRGPGGAKLKAASSSVTAAVGEGSSAARLLKQHGVSREDAATALRVGQKEKSVPVYKTVQVKDRSGRVTGTKQVRVLNPDGTPKTRTTPGLPQVKDDLLLRAAIELAYDGYISKATRDRLNERGLTAASIGTVYWQPAAKRAMRRNAAQRRRRRPHLPGTTGVAPAVGGARPG